MNDIALMLALAVAMFTVQAVVSLMLYMRAMNEPLETIAEGLSWLAAIALVAIIALSVNV